MKPSRPDSAFGGELVAVAGEQVGAQVDVEQVFERLRCVEERRARSCRGVQAGQTCAAATSGGNGETSERGGWHWSDELVLESAPEFTQFCREVKCDSVTL